MKRVRKYHLLFGLALLALMALAVWWTIFFARSVELERKAHLSQLTHASVVAALTLGHGQQMPGVGPIPGPVPLEIVPAADAKSSEIFTSTLPNFPDYGVRPTADAVARIESAMSRRRFMAIGEGAFMFILLGVCTFMLYRLVRQERRHSRRMEEFVATVTHEMKTPLTGIKSMLQTFADGRVPEKSQDRLYAMGLKEAERLEHMVENILISGRLRGGRYRLKVEAVELRPLLEGFVDYRQRYLIRRPEAIKLQWEPKKRDLEIQGDHGALRVILDNLVDNALKYGGPEPRVIVWVREFNQLVEITVQDNGIGFAPDKAEELFVPFQRVMELPDSAQPGTGLGLTIARALARQMGGDLTAKSEGPGEGSKFSITLREAGS